MASLAGAVSGGIALRSLLKGGQLKLRAAQARADDAPIAKQASDPEGPNGGAADAATTAVSFAKGISDNNAAAISDGQDIGDTKAADDAGAAGIPAAAEIGKFLSALKGISDNDAAAAASLAGAASGGIALRSLLKGGQLKLRVAQAGEAPIAKQAGLAAVTPSRQQRRLPRSYYPPDSGKIRKLPINKAN
ncbi:hypothetical protein [Borrelia sp. RT5S]|uniref:hypothetical protein n=1 Tax=Borrelia sp. RT5S TaxID=2898581 RepID=UPI001E4E0131|nr:hypothetical protein [Borrelia sp. RT5S]UGQ16630.1 hypothetical protein LSO06_04650 [Borrelia sp. RT5S]